jgi:hypothetical protein|tara:strand:+ start:2970 stop:3404 length:435 start_codon:yes stop_codon:yes gene_type:complete
MQISRLKINIEDLYISKPLEKETYSKVMGENPNTLHSLYLIANELKAMHYFISLDDHPDYSISAYINIYHGYCNKARQQIGAIPSMSDKLKNRPYFVIKYKITNKNTMQEEFSFRHMSSNKNEIYKLIEVFHKKTEKLCKTNTF